MHTVNKQASTFKQVGDRIRTFQNEVETEPWKQEHLEAMACLSFESTLKFGLDIYEALHKVDTAVRGVILSDGKCDKEKTLKGLRLLFEWWLKPCGRVEKDLIAFEKRGFKVENADAFRKAHAECVWILKPAKEAFGDDRLIEARDQAVDALRSGNVESFPSFPG